jgi:hypothetical protein
MMSAAGTYESIRPARKYLDDPDAFLKILVTAN